MKVTLVIFIALALAGFSLLSLQMGVISVPWRALLTDWQAEREYHYVLTAYRLPRLLLALFVGAALAVAGVLVQGIVRNPLASPDILGVNHAASLASVGALLLVPSLPVIALPLLAFAGGMVGLILLRMLVNTSQPMKLALTGVALSACWASLTDWLMLSRPQDVNSALLWLTGSLWGRDWSFVKIAVPLLMLFLPLSLGFCRDLDLLALGDARHHARGVGAAYPAPGFATGRRHDIYRCGRLRPDQLYWSRGAAYGAQYYRWASPLAAAHIGHDRCVAAGGCRPAGANYSSPAGASGWRTDRHYRCTVVCLAACENAINDITN